MPDLPTPVDPVDEELNQGVQKLAESDLSEVEATIRYMVVAIESDARLAPVAPDAAEAAQQQADGAAIHQHRSQAPPSDLLKQTVPLDSPVYGAERVAIAARSPGQQQLPEDTISVSTTPAINTTAAASTAAAAAAANGVAVEVLGACQDQEQSDPEAASNEQEQKKQEGASVELITPERVQELIEVGRTTEEGFRELIRFLGRTLSNPACVSASFSLAPHLQEGTTPPGITSPQPTPTVASDADRGACGGEASDAERDAPSDAATDASTNNVDDATVEVDTNITRSAIDTAAAAADSLTTAATAAAATEEPPPSSRGWADQSSSVGMDVAAAAEVWKLLRKLNADAVTGTVLNALEALTQELYMESFLGRGGGGGGGSEATATAAGATATATAATSTATAAATATTTTATAEGVAVEAAAAGEEAGVSGGGGVSAREKADVRAIVLVLEHPEIQDPDFEGVLGILFKLATRLTMEGRAALCGFFEGLEEERFTRYLGAVHQSVALQLYSGGYSSAVLTAVQFIRLLYVANQKTPKVKDEAFYSEAINSEVFSHRPSLVEVYKDWRLDHLQSNPTQFKSLISFGEVLDPASKAAVLSLDSQVQMRGTINNEFQEAMVSGNLSEMGLAITPYLVLRVRRSKIVQDSLLALVMLPDEDLKKPLRVQFVGEEGIDEGGLQKEYFQVMLRELLDPKYSMLKHDEETRALWFNSDSLEAEEEFELVGMLLGIAIYNGIILDVRFPLVVYKLVMGATPTLEDLKEAQPALGRGLQKLLDFEGDVESTFARTFQISYEVFGAVKTFDLKEGGGETVVTKDNREEYVNLYVRWLLVESVKGQYGPFERGFHKVVGGKALSLFRPEELELLICGNPELDFEALEQKSKYEDGYERDDDVIKNLWEVVHEFGEDSKRKLLKFVTGSDRAPIQGLGSVGLSLVISKNGDDSDRLPTAHTCFNHLLLPSYSSKAKLEDRLKLAIEQSEGFGLR